MAVEADEPFLAAVMHMERRLIALARIEPPVPDDEVGPGVPMLARFRSARGGGHVLAVMSPEIAELIDKLHGPTSAVDSQGLVGSLPLGARLIGTLATAGDPFRAP